MFQEISCAEVNMTVMKGSAVLDYCSEFDRSFLPTLSSHNTSNPLTKMLFAQHINLDSLLVD